MKREARLNRRSMAVVFDQHPKYGSGSHAAPLPQQKKLFQQAEVETAEQTRTKPNTRLGYEWEDIGSWSVGEDFEISLGRTSERDSTVGECPCSLPRALYDLTLQERTSFCPQRYLPSSISSQYTRVLF